MRGLFDPPGKSCWRGGGRAWPRKQVAASWQPIKFDSAPSSSSVADHLQSMKKPRQLRELQTDLPLDRDSTI